MKLQWKMFKDGESLAGFSNKYCKILSFIFIFLLLKSGKSKTKQK